MRMDELKCKCGKVLESCDNSLVVQLDLNKPETWKGEISLQLYCRDCDIIWDGDSLCCEDEHIESDYEKYIGWFK